MCNGLSAVSLFLSPHNLLLLGLPSTLFPGLVTFKSSLPRCLADLFTIKIVIFVYETK